MVYSSATPNRSVSSLLDLYSLSLRYSFKKTIWSALNSRRCSLVAMLFLLERLEVELVLVKCLASLKLNKLQEPFLALSRKSLKLIQNSLELNNH